MEIDFCFAGAGDAEEKKGALRFSVECRVICDQ